MSEPCFVMVVPQMGENIGAAARVMANFGLHDLRLVAPRDGWPNAAAETMSAGALPDVVTARVFDTVEAAIADCGIVFATTARPREMEKPVVDAAGAVAQMRATSAKAAILFGGERAGLPNEAVALADAILSYPVDRSFASLNLAQAVQVVAWELRMAMLDGIAEGPATPEGKPADGAQMEQYFAHLARALDAIDFHKGRSPERIMQRLRRLYLRAAPDQRELRVLHGILADTGRIAAIAARTGPIAAPPTTDAGAGD